MAKGGSRLATAGLQGQECAGEHRRAVAGQRFELPEQSWTPPPSTGASVNVGTISGSPSPPPSQGGGGQVRRRLMSPGWGGALVVVRGRESRPHGEGGQRSAGRVVECQEVAGEHRRTLPDARSKPRRRVLGIQTKLHQWATDDPNRRFDDLFNLVSDPAFLVVAWERVRGNRGARSAGVDGVAPRSIVFGQGRFLAGLREDLKARRFEPLPVRERMIPKAGGKRRRLGIPTARDRVVQAALKLVLEPIFEADFQPVQLRVPPEAPSPGRHRRDPSPGLPPATSGCWRVTSRRASTRHHTAPAAAGVSSKRPGRGRSP